MVCVCVGSVNRRVCVWEGEVDDEEEESVVLRTTALGESLAKTLLELYTHGPAIHVWCEGKGSDWSVCGEGWCGL